MTNPAQLISVRKKKLGVLVLDARLATRKTQEECAQALGISLDRFQAFETGAESPSLPELETLAYFLKIPLEHFWGSASISEDHQSPSIKHIDQYYQLRQRVLGVSILLRRTTSNITVEELSQKTGLEVDRISQFELGQETFSMPELEVLAKALDFPIENLIDKKGPVGKWLTQENSVHDFLDLPIEIRNFITKPVNHPYLELAMKLSALNVEKLRSIAESLLEITY